MATYVLNGGAFYEENVTNSGTGNYDTFVRVQDKGIEESFNTSEDKILDNVGGVFTHDLAFADIQTVTLPGGSTEYVEFRLDLNEAQKEISLTEFKIWVSDAGATGSDYTGSGNFGTGFYLTFDLTGTLNLLANNGSGLDEYRFLIPLSAFNKAISDAGLNPATANVTLYTAFSGADSGFEEWRILTNHAVVEPTPVITIDKSGPVSIDEGGDTATYTFVITASLNNASSDPLTIDSVIDDKFGNLTSAAILANGGLPIVLAPGQSFTFQFTSPLIVLNAFETHTNVVTVTAHDNENVVVTDTDDHKLTAEDVLPDVQIVKSADVAGFNEGTPTDILYTYRVTNLSSASTDPLKIDSIVDNQLGPIAHYLSGDDGDGLFEKGETWIYTALASGVNMNVGSLTNIVKVIAHDDEGNSVSDTDTVTIPALDVLPGIQVVKTASVASFNEGVSTDVTYTYTVKNLSQASTDPLAIDSFIDDKIGNITNLVSGDLNHNQLLEQSETWVFTKTASGLVLNAGSLTNLVTVTAHDDENNQVSDTDTVTIPVIDTKPLIDIVKTVDANGDHVFNDSETIGAGTHNVTYRYAITNNSALTDPLTIKSLFDDKIGVLDFFSPTSGDTDNDHIFDSGETWVFEVAKSITLAPNHDVLINSVTVNAVDDENNAVTDSDTAQVESFAGPGVRTPGFWANNGLQFWDGKAGFTKSGPFFPDHELAPIGAAATTFLILGGDHDNILEAGEIQISLKDALTMINASTKQQQDGRWMLARDAIAAELNMRAGNPGTDGVHAVDPQHLLNDAVMWLDLTTNNDHTLTAAELASGGVKTSDLSKWANPYGGVDHAASVLHTQLDGYNNNGTVFGVQYANDGDFV